jgi:hypothetical protein
VFNGKLVCTQFVGAFISISASLGYIEPEYDFTTLDWIVTNGIVAIGPSIFGKKTLA